MLPGDIILADRGFDIEEDVAMMQASLKIPAFTKGVSQLSPVDIEKTRKLANLRIHVERVIGATRQRYSILMSTLPIQYMKAKSPQEVPIVDKILRVCSALNNLCVSVVATLLLIYMPWLNIYYVCSALIKKRCTYYIICDLICKNPT